MATITDVKPASAVFIDVPNVNGGGKKDWRNRFKWERLSQAIAASEVFVGTDLILANAYVSKWEDREPLLNWSRNAFRTFSGTAFGMEVCFDGDVDWRIVNDMWRTVAQKEQESIRNGVIEYPIQVRFILVSGDSDYARVINSMREAYGDHLEIELYVYSWIENLSPELARIANQVTYLENVPNFVRGT